STHCSTRPRPPPGLAPLARPGFAPPAAPPPGGRYFQRARRGHYSAGADRWKVAHLCWESHSARLERSSEPATLIESLVRGCSHSSWCQCSSVSWLRLLSTSGRVRLSGLHGYGRVPSSSPGVQVSTSADIGRTTSSPSSRCGRSQRWAAWQGHSERSSTG